VLCLGQDEENLEELKDVVAWNNLKDKAKKWIHLDIFGDVYERVCWKDGPVGNFAHRKCKSYMGSSRNLTLATKRRKPLASIENLGGLNGDVAEPSEDIPELCASVVETRVNGIRRTRRDGPLYDDNLCIFCMKPQDKRHCDRKYSHLYKFQVGITFIGLDILITFTYFQHVQSDYFVG
jgi:hypothetical protein